MWLIVEHRLWKRPQSADSRDRAVLYNAATVVTGDNRRHRFPRRAVRLAVSDCLVDLPPEMVAQNIGHPVELSSLLLMAWLVAAGAIVTSPLAGTGPAAGTRYLRPVRFTGTMHANLSCAAQCRGLLGDSRKIALFGDARFETKRARRACRFFQGDTRL